MVHRDIKSRNIFLCRTGRALLGDFGLVRLLEDTLELARTRVGTPYYLSPEIIQRQPYNCKTDVWSLGVLLYEMTALKRPFAGTLETLPKAILEGNYDPLSDSYSEGLRNLVAGMLHVDPGHRTELADALSGVLKTPLDRAREALNLEVVIPIPRKPKDVEDVSDPASDSGDDLIDFNTMIRREAGQYVPPPASADGRGTTVPTQQKNVVKVANLGTFGTIGAGYNTMVRPIRLTAAMMDEGQDWSVQRVIDPDSGDEDISMSSDSWGSRVDIGEGNVAMAEV
jgi:serine/threonine protein kinase